MVKNTSSLYAVHCNVNGLLCSFLLEHSLAAGSHFKIDFLRHSLSADSVPKVLCITESKLDKLIDGDEIDIANYIVFRNDRRRKGDGVAFYCLSSLQLRRLL